MAIGGDYSNSNYSRGNSSNSDSNQKGLYERTYYSRFRIKQPKDKGNYQLSLNFRSGLMIVNIDEFSNNQYTTLETIYVSPSKAYLLAEELKKFKAYVLAGDIKENVAFGINGGMGEKISYIAFHASEDKKLFVTIGKFGGDNGAIVEKVTMELNTDYYNALEWADVTDMSSVSRVMYDFLEIDQLTAICEDFARYSAGAAAYSVLDLGRYDLERITKKMDPIYSKLGIETNHGNGYSNGSKGSNFLNNLGKNGNTYNTASSHTTIDDLEEDLLD